MRKTLTTLAAALAVGHASAAVYDTEGVPVSNDGNQNYGEMLGNDFTVNVSGLLVTQLGAFNDDLDGITTNISVGLYDLTDHTVVINPISFKGLAGSSTYLFRDLPTPVTLIAQHTYSVQAFGYNDSDENYNTNITPVVNNGSDAQSTTPITFNGMGGRLTNRNSRYGNTTMGEGKEEFAHSSAFGAGTLTVSAVPEPQAYAMMMAGLLAMSFLGTRRKK